MNNFPFKKIKYHYSSSSKKFDKKNNIIIFQFASGQFQFPHQNQLFRVEPNMWSARQIPLALLSYAVGGNVEKNNSTIFDEVDGQKELERDERELEEGEIEEE